MMARSQQGIALVTAILVVALAAVAATAILTSANIAIHRTGNLQDSERAWWYADGIEGWLRTILERDQEDNKYDGLGDIWAKPVDYLPVDDGFVRGQMVDLQGRYNLNNLAVADPQALKLQQEIFLRLLQNIEGVDAFKAQAIASSIRDWIDADSEPTGFDGAEDSEYLGINPPYRVPNRLMESPSELLAVKGMTKDLYQRLRPYVAALPQTGTPINVNTAPEAVLYALAKEPGTAQRQFLEERTKKPAENVSELTGTRGVFGGADAPNTMLAVASRYFMLRAEIFVGSGRLALYSFYYRPEQGAPVVIGRSIDTE
ncbi:MAG TPA: type II secretion system minor pseudopilin GspK [Solimonas sp.]|nr:type II secretion system minor pseudopilin GspK [Solimonas sp.]